MTKLCDAAACAKIALDKVVCESVSVAALEFYAKVVEFIRLHTCIDIGLIFQVIAILAVICWIQQWLLEIINFVLGIPKLIKKLFCGKLFPLCVFDCCDKPVHESEDSSSSSSDTY